MWLRQVISNGVWCVGVCTVRSRQGLDFVPFPVKSGATAYCGSLLLPSVHVWPQGVRYPHIFCIHRHTTVACIPCKHCHTTVAYIPCKHPIQPMQTKTQFTQTAHQQHRHWGRAGCWQLKKGSGLCSWDGALHSTGPSTRRVTFLHLPDPALYPCCLKSSATAVVVLLFLSCCSDTLCCVLHVCCCQV